MNRNQNVRLSSLVLGLSSALDLVNWFIVKHHLQVARFALKIAAEAGFPDEEKSTIAMAAALHDIGAISFNEPFSASFDTSFDTEDMSRHAELGYHLLGNFRPFLRAAELVRYHHVPWSDGRGREYEGRRVPTGSHVIHLADRVAVLIKDNAFVLCQAEEICEAIRRERGGLFVPELVDIFLQLGRRESFWLDAAYATPDHVTDGAPGQWHVELDQDLLLDFSELFRMIIDFRSPNTAAHSKDVASLSSAIAGFLGFSEQERQMLRIAGNLHDLGKLAVPVNVLDKPGPLDRRELFIMRGHPFHTYRVLERIGGMRDVNACAAFHHECLDGSGYPFRREKAGLPLGARIVAVADVLSALTEDRAYRKAMDYATAITHLRQMGKEQRLDPEIVALVERHYGDIRDVNVAANDEGVQEFRSILQAAETRSSGAAVRDGGA